MTDRPKPPLTPAEINQKNREFWEKQDSYAESALNIIEFLHEVSASPPAVDYSSLVQLGKALGQAKQEAAEIQKQLGSMALSDLMALSRLTGLGALVLAETITRERREKLKYIESGKKNSDKKKEEEADRKSFTVLCFKHKDRIKKITDLYTIPDFEHYLCKYPPRVKANERGSHTLRDWFNKSFPGRLKPGRRKCTGTG
jgi:hypothetical protein